MVSNKAGLYGAQLQAEHFLPKLDFTYCCIMLEPTYVCFFVLIAITAQFKFCVAVSGWARLLVYGCMQNPNLF